MRKETKPKREPFNIGDTVSIIRTRHGWFDGDLHGVVKERFLKNNGLNASYKVLGDDGYL